MTILNNGLPLHWCKFGFYVVQKHTDLMNEECCLLGYEDAEWLFVSRDVSEECNASINRTRIGELGTTLAVTSN
jgi:hypothetical protein